MLHEPSKLLIRLIVTVFQHFPHTVPPQKGQLPLIPDTEGRIYVQAVIMAADDIQAEAVNGGNLCLGDQGCLEPQMLVLRTFLQLLLHCGAYPLPHLSRSCIGKRHYQQLVNIQGTVSFAYHPDDTFHQHGRLTAARCRGHQKVPVSAVYNLLLFTGPIHCHLFPHLLQIPIPPRFPQA